RSRSRCPAGSAGPGTVTIARALPASRIRTVRGLAGASGSVTSRARSSGSTRIGGTSTNPWELRVRQRSTGSPPAPTSGSSSVVGMPHPPASPPGPDLVAVAALLHRAPTTRAVPRAVVEHRHAGLVPADLEPVPRAVDLGEEPDGEDPPEGAEHPGRPCRERGRPRPSETKLQARRASGRLDDLDVLATKRATGPGLDPPVERLVNGEGDVQVLRSRPVGGREEPPLHQERANTLGGGWQAALVAPHVVVNGQERAHELEVSGRGGRPVHVPGPLLDVHVTSLPSRSLFRRVRPRPQDTPSFTIDRLQHRR